MVQAGFLPTFANLMSQGVHGPLKAWPNLNSAAAWSSIVTGYNPGMHGVHDFGSAPPQRGYAWHPMTALDRKKDPFWRLLSAKGKRVTIINVPISYPADPINGYMLAGMDTPGLSSHGFAHPPELRDEISRQGIDYIIDVPNLGDLSRKHPDQLPIQVKKDGGGSVPNDPLPYGKTMGCLHGRFRGNRSSSTLLLAEWGRFPSRRESGPPSVRPIS